MSRLVLFEYENNVGNTFNVSRFSCVRTRAHAHTLINMFFIFLNGQDSQLFVNSLSIFFNT